MFGTLAQRTKELVPIAWSLGFLVALSAGCGPKGAKFRTLG